MTTPRVYTMRTSLEVYSGKRNDDLNQQSVLVTVPCLESRDFKELGKVEFILLSDHKEVVEKLEATIEAFTSSYPKLERGLFLEQQLVKRQALAIEKLKEVIKATNDKIACSPEHTEELLAAILQEAK